MLAIANTHVIRLQEAMSLYWFVCIAPLSVSETGWRLATETRTSSTPNGDAFLTNHKTAALTPSHTGGSKLPWSQWRGRALREWVGRWTTGCWGPWLLFPHPPHDETTHRKHMHMITADSLWQNKFRLIPIQIRSTTGKVATKRYSEQHHAKLPREPHLYALL